MWGEFKRVKGLMATIATRHSRDSGNPERGMESNIGLSDTRQSNVG